MPNVEPALDNNRLAYQFFTENIFTAISLSSYQFVFAKNLEARELLLVSNHDGTSDSLSVDTF